MSSAMRPDVLNACGQLRDAGVDVAPVILAVSGLSPDPADRRSRSAQAIAERTIKTAWGQLDVASPNTITEAADMLRGATALCLYAMADEAIN